MTTYVPAKVNTEYIFYMGLVSRSTGQFQSNPTLAAGDVKVSKDGGALNNLTTLPAVTPASSKMVKVTVSATEMNAANITLVFSDAAGAEWDDCIVNIQTVANQLDDLSARIPAALSGDGFMKADLKSIEDELTSGNYATLNLKTLSIIRNDIGTAVNVQSNHATGGTGVSVYAGRQAITLLGNGEGATAYDTVVIENGGSGASIYAPQGIFGSDYEDLSVTNITDKVWDEAIAGHLTGGSTGAALNGAGAAGDPWGTNIPGAYSAGTAGYILGNNLNATISSRLADSDYVDPDNAGIAGIKAQTDKLGFDSDNYIYSHPMTAVTVGTNNDKTGYSLTSAYDPAKTASQDSDIPTADITAIKAKTDQLTFTNPGEVDANIQAVNDTELTGNGSTQPWGPA